MINAVDMQEVSFSYGEAPCLEGLSVSFPQGCITSIVGPNGCGKSTLIKLIDGMYRPQAGEVRVCGCATLGLGSKQRARIVAVLAQTSRPPAMSVEALVACGRYPYQRHAGRLGAEDKDHIERALELAGVMAHRHHDVRRLSGGERQRAHIAMTLAQDTDVIVLDEPTTYLDIRACYEIMELVRMLNESQGKTIIMVMHDLDLALRYSDRLMVMDQGRCVCDGSVKSVLASGTIERAFAVQIHPAYTPAGRAYTLFPA